MATYKKPLKTVKVITTCGEEYTVADTAEKAIGSTAYSQFAGGQTLTLETGENEITYVPFHAICAVVVTTSTTDAEKADPYGCEDTETETNPEP